MVMYVFDEILNVPLNRKDKVLNYISDDIDDNAEKMCNELNLTHSIKKIKDGYRITGTRGIIFNREVLIADVKLKAIENKLVYSISLQVKLNLLGNVIASIRDRTIRQDFKNNFEKEVEKINRLFGNRK